MIDDQACPSMKGNLLNSCNQHVTDVVDKDLTDEAIQTSSKDELEALLAKRRTLGSLPRSGSFDPTRAQIQVAKIEAELRKRALRTAGDQSFHTRVSTTSHRLLLWPLVSLLLSPGTRCYADYTEQSCKTCRGS